MKVKKDNILFYVRLIGGYLLLISVSCAIIYPLLKNKNPTEHVEKPSSYFSKSTGETTLPVSEIWRISNINLLHSDIPSGMVAFNNYVCFVSYDNSGQRSLQTVDAASGELLWSVDVPSVSSIILGQEKIFIAVLWDIRAYSLLDGTLLWQSEQLAQHTGYRFHPIVKEEVLVYSVEDNWNKREQVLQYYNTRNGALEMLRQEITPDEWLVLRLSGLDLWARSDDRVWAISKPDNKILWEIEVDQQYNNTPTWTNTTFFFLDGRFPKLQAVDINTGSLIWEHNEEIVSNIELSENILYALRIDGTLIALDPHTGQEVGFVKFTSSSEISPGTKAYWVAITPERIFVYFGDSKELIAFAFSNP